MLGEMLKNTEKLAVNKVNNQSEWLIQGVKSKIYQPLLKRPASGNTLYLFKTIIFLNTKYYYKLINLKLFFPLIVLIIY